MHRISKSAIVPYTPQQMFELVNNIDDYSQFLNWCDSSSILNQSDDQITASVEINKGGIKQTFSTLNTLTPYQSIAMELVDGPFDELSGEWRFEPLGENAAKIHLDLQFKFKSMLIDMALSPVFKNIANSQLDSFVARAKYIYG
ncbi:type II toxin-antitoxin system RatA family toxin [Candidatus Thioglobus sp.]|jgi:ribosome-associated toxin RatA of RatAB toxin-antitoxin module|uniref:type II toxin-antitoxin system RatA family toxin n=1 Tax=unclassified Candidatus Pseudothioglobus TaxID=3072908 RepID=UPI00230BF6AA|nr:type II toxin-antitoxin system RatA family toxin [Candidatus Thioglobus sp.]MDB9938610.1 type II toxin-antitoxin system RatA family toxin [Candidatus Thioglobus sp.]MDB9950983.1 type II toxin-antitoxin system RatA family toxin [Candidatus Thioglobus sp.]MDC1290218.1 type II toxin-antitoxin system RatA family toxin [Candidatus Thioglobus sp.]MDC1418179.1 type II toxin-antitoxin system RatA family toxin [Candidatus Thioglobus sp.]|tara:strand:+ start:356 stop:787 length:432 start_codon:yes stop_codon:yes gene_type:complete